MASMNLSVSDLEAQGRELGTLSMGSFLKTTQGQLNFFDGIKWSRVSSEVHMRQLEGALEIYLDKQLEHVEQTMAMALSERNGVLFEEYQKSIMAISDRIRSQTIEYRDKTKTGVLETLKKFLKDKNTFDDEVAGEDGLTDADKALLSELNGEATSKNIEAIYNEMITEFDHYTDMCQRIYIGMANEIEKHRTIDATPS